MAVEVSRDVPELTRGEPLPLGATLSPAGINFAVYARSATQVELCIFDPVTQIELYRLMLPAHTAGVWHGFLPTPWAQAGLLYGWRVHGKYQPTHGLRYNPNKLLIDPYARLLQGAFQWHPSVFGFKDVEVHDIPNTQDSASYVPKSVVTEAEFEWQGDCPPSIPWRDTIIYEVHVKGFTQLHPEVPAAHRGTYLGMAHPVVIQYLKQLGITAVELMPVQEFISEEFLVKKNLSN